MGKFIKLFFCLVLVFFGYFIYKQKNSKTYTPYLQKTKDNVYTELFTSTCATLNPQLIDDVRTFRVSNDLFEGLLRYDPKNKLIPAGAYKWDISDDGKRYTFYLRKDAKWSNGDPVTAHDYVFSWKNGLKKETSFLYWPSAFDSILNAIDIKNNQTNFDELGVRAIDDYTLEILLKEQNPLFLDLLANQVLSPIYFKTVELNPIGWGNDIDPEKFVCNGAYIPTKWINNGTIELKKNPHYWDKKNVKIEKVKFIVNSEPGIGVQLYKTNEIPYCGFSQILSDSEANKEFPNQVHNATKLYVEWYQFNFDNPKFKDIKVRKALAISVDKKSMIKVLFNSNNEDLILHSPVCNHIANGAFKNFYKTVPEYSWIDYPIEKRIEMAQKLLKEAGYSEANPLEFSISYSNHRKVVTDLAIFMKSNWEKALGKLVKISLKGSEWKLYLQEISNKNFEMCRFGTTAEYNYPGTYLAYLLGNSQFNANYHNPIIDELYLKSLQCSSIEDHLKVQSEIIKILMSDYVVIPMHTSLHRILLQGYLKGYYPEDNPLNIVYSKDLELLH